MRYLEQEGSSGRRVDFCPMEVGDGMRQWKGVGILRMRVGLTLGVENECVCLYWLVLLDASILYRKESVFVTMKQVLRDCGFWSQIVFYVRWCSEKHSGHHKRVSFAPKFRFLFVALTMHATIIRLLYI